MFRGTLFMAVCLLAYSAQAAEKRPFRWQLNPGDVFHVEFRQRVSHVDSLTSGVAQALGRGAPRPTAHELALELSWEVADATDASPSDYRQYPKIKLTQTLKRVVADFQFGGLARKQYDSAKPPGENNAAHDSLQKYLNKPMKFYLTQSGHLDYDTASIDWTAFFTEEWFVKANLARDNMGALMETLLPQFPADCREPWEREVKLYLLGKMVETGKMVYTYTPQASRRSNVRIRLDGKLKNEAAGGNPQLAALRVAGHKCTGEIRFDIDRGHVTTAKLQELVLEDFGDPNNFIRNRHEKSVQLTIRRESANQSNRTR